MQTHQMRLVILGSASFEERPAFLVSLSGFKGRGLCGAFEGL
ncbi:hypothetical protein NBRC3293_3118 [Gluconobacter oxydans NBRC 3293]|uniref:Uncharacterized protein n=1 Tax=Gluconobacter oxydans NBRC 3293 TaxID=1315969 RepID=A0A829WNQ3_GLUOY|nr:hypothetical protein NBRC3293_2934 [Gluconobacter oxydans NBRC 3293]GEM18620.1 hypothetical protein NBRC3293_3118 [Gluconobacter oxydans NBRC 3293]